MNVGGCFHFTSCLKQFLYYGKDQYEMSDILLYLQLQKITHLRFCTFCIFCSPDALALITYFRLQMAEDLKGTVLHFHSHHLYLFSEFRQVTKYYWRLEQYWSNFKNSSNISNVSNIPVPHCLSKDKKFEEKENLEPKAVWLQQSLEKWFLTHPLSGFILVSCSLQCPGGCFIALISPGWLCFALLCWDLFIHCC